MWKFKAEVKNKAHQITLLELENNALRFDLKLVTEVNTKDVTVTFYHPDSKGINSDSDPSKTATMTEPVAGRTVAISSELIEAGWLGSKIYIEGIGVFKAEDRMNTKLKGLRIDICVTSYKEAIKRGKLKKLAVKL